MSTTFAFKSIVTDGLILNMDAANRKSFVSGSTSWYDLSGRGNIGTLSGGTGYNSSNGGFLTFDGINNKIIKNGTVDTGQNFTVNVWIYPIQGSTGHIINNGYMFSNSNPTIGWRLRMGGGFFNAFSFAIGYGGSFGTTVTNTLTPNEWVYLSVVCVSGGTSLDFYKNGNKITVFGSSNMNSGTITYTGSSFNISYYDPSFPDLFTGNISNVQLYNRALSSTEVLQNYNALKGRYI